jgi:hypothetical protein
MIRKTTSMAVRSILLAAAAFAGWTAQAGAIEEEPYFLVTPEHATGPVGRDHTITATPIREERETQSLEVDNHEYVGFIFFFEIIAGPNAGLNSENGGQCRPSDCEGGFNEVIHPVSWTYSGRRPGTDVIRVCGEVPVGTESSREETQCVLVTKTWVDGGFPLGGNIADQARENRERVAAAAQAPAVTAPATGTGIVTPPSTGDAGLSSSRGSAEAWLPATAAAIGLAAVGGAGALRRRAS